MQGLPERALRRVHAALMELGACVCTPKSPKCEVCPTKSFCRAYKAGNVTKYPVKRPKAAKKTEERTVLLLEATADSPWKSEARRVCSPGYGSFRTYLKSSMPKPPCKQRRASHRPEGADARNAQDAHFHAYSLGDDRLCDPLQRDVRSVYMASLAELERDFALPTAFRQFSDE